MPMQIEDDGNIKFPSPDYLTLENFKRGVITLIDPSRVPRNALVELRNGFLVEDGQPSLRPGVDWFGAPLPNSAEIDGFDYFDFGGIIHLVATGGGKTYRSTNDGKAWTECTGVTLTAGAEVNMNQYNAFLYMTNGLNDITRYDGTTVLKQYTALNTPAPATANAVGLTGTQYTFYYKVSAVSAIGFSAASTKTTVQTSLDRTSWDANKYVELTVPAPQATQTRMDIYISIDDLNYYYLDSIVSSTATPNVTYRDNGTAQTIPSTTAPTDNTTKGPKVQQLTNVGTRMFGTRDPQNRYRIWFTSGAPPLGSFAGGYDGGYLDWQLGGKYLPVRAEDYRDGKGTPIATIWCDSADGQGCIIQMSLDTITAGAISVTVPHAYKLPGSRGTPAPGSVINVLNDYHFYNSQAVYNLGNREKMPVPILSTDELSANIRPSIKRVNNSAEKRIASAYFDAKVYYSVPLDGSATNNYTMVYDTEQQAWIPEAFTIGFKKFLRYTDTEGTQHLLAIKPGDNRLSEISENIQGDYGQPFEHSLRTGLYPVSRNRFEFQFTEEMEFEFSNPQDTIYVELLGIDRVKGFRSIRTVPFYVPYAITNAGWDTTPWDTLKWDDTATVPVTFSESSTKRYKNVQTELNAVQWHIYTNSLAANYVLRTLQTWGTITQGGKPSQWRAR